MGGLCASQGDWQNANRFFNEASQVYEDSGDLMIGKMILNEIAWENWRNGDIRKGIVLMEEYVKAQRQFPAGFAISWALSNLASMLVWAGDFQVALEYARESGEGRRRFSPSEEGAGLDLYGWIQFLQGNFTEARQSFENSLKVNRSEQYDRGVFWSLFRLGVLYILDGQLEHGQALMDESRTVFDQLPFLLGWQTMEYYYWLAVITHRCQDYARARDHSLTALRFIWSRKEMPRIPENLEIVAAAAVGMQEYLPAARLLGAADRQRQTMDVQIHPVMQPDYEKALLELKAALPEAQFQLAWAQGAAMSVAESVDLAFSIGSPGST